MLYDAIVSGAKREREEGRKEDSDGERERERESLKQRFILQLIFLQDLQAHTVEVLELDTYYMYVGGMFVTYSANFSFFSFSFCFYVFHRSLCFFVYFLF